MILLVQKYSPECQTRRGEIEKCLKNNSESGLFSSVATIDGDEKRITLGEMFDACHSRFQGELCVVANSDIIFDETIRLAEKCLRGCAMLALTRWEGESSPNMLGHYENARFFSGSQDSWAFYGGSIPRVDVEIPMGHVGCDNAIVGWAVKKGVRVANPAIDIRTFHVHSDGGRPERPSVYGYYGYPELTTLSISDYVLCHSVEEEGFHHLCKFV